MGIDFWGAVIAILVGVGAIGKATWDYVIKPLMIKLKNKKTRDQKLDDIIGSMSELTSQFSTNGGSTIKDQLNRIEVRQLFSDQTSRATVDALGIGLWQSDSNGFRTEVSPTLCKILGRSESELKGNNWQTWIHPHQKDYVIDEWERCVKNKSEFSIKYLYLRKDSNEIEIQSHATPVIDNISGKFVGFVGMVNEVK